MTWAEALEALKQGKRVRRAIWFAELYLKIMPAENSDLELCFFDNGELDYLCFLAVQDLEATDWQWVN